MNSTGIIAGIKTFAVHDGPGIRTTLFLKGCSLRCAWCHNPETLRQIPELAFYAAKCIGCGACVSTCQYHHIEYGIHKIDRDQCRVCGKCAEKCPVEALRVYGQRITVDEAFKLLSADKMFYDNSGGGVTISGGEPLLQAEFCEELCTRLQKADIRIAIDTCGNVPWQNFERILDRTNLILYDLKSIDSEVHYQCTGSGNITILENLRKLDQAGIPLEIRMPLMSGWNDSDENIEAAGRFFDSFRHTPVSVRLLHCHTLMRSKYAALEIPYSRSEIVPSADRLPRIAEILRLHAVRLIN